MRVLMVSNRYKEATAAMAREMVSHLEKHGVEIAFDNGLEVPVPEYCHDFDLMIVFGGDGTILRAARRYAATGVPVLGVNMGTIGFLSNIEVHELEEYIPNLLAHGYRLDQRMMLQVTVQNGEQITQQGCCLNEMVIKSAEPHMITLTLEVGDDLAGNYRGDGLIVATPTGSTAYSLSCGGPVTDPDLDVMVVTPIASQIISRKPMIVAGSKQIKLQPIDGQEGRLCLDGQVQIPLHKNSTVRVCQADYKLKLINLKTTSFFHKIDARLRRSEGL